MSRSGRQIINTQQSAGLARRRNIFTIATIAIVAVVILGVIIYANQVPKSATTAANTATIKVGDAAPDFSVSTTSGPFVLSAAKGEPTFLEVFATWCPHCQREVSVINPLYLTFKDKVHFVAVNGSPLGADQQAESQADVVAFQQKFSVAYPVAFDPDLDVAHKYLQNGFPTIVLIGPDGKIESIASGEIPAKDLQAALTAVVAGKKPDPALGFIPPKA